MNLSDSQFREESVIIRHASMFNADLFHVIAPKLISKRYKWLRIWQLRDIFAFDLNIRLYVINRHCQNYASAVLSSALAVQSCMIWLNSTRRAICFETNPGDGWITCQCLFVKSIFINRLSCSVFPAIYCTRHVLVIVVICLLWLGNISYSIRLIFHTSYSGLLRWRWSNYMAASVPAK